MCRGFYKKVGTKTTGRASVAPLMGSGSVFIEGEYVAPEEAKISVFDPGFTRGDAVYDTVSVWKGQFFRLSDHIERFFRSCERGRLVCPHAPDEVEEILAQCVHRGGLESAYVQMIVTRGPFPSLERRDPRLCENRFIALAVPYIWVVPPERHGEGIDLAIASTRRTPVEAIDPRMKNFNWLDLQGGLFEALDRGADTVVLCTTSGLLAEGPGFNLFLISDGKLFTPRLNVLEGITRSTVFDLAKELGLPAKEADMEPGELRDADEAFICSTAGGIMPVAKVDGERLGNGRAGEISLQLRELYWRKREDGWLGTPVSSLVPAATA